MSRKVFSTSEIRKRVAAVVGTRPGVVMFAPVIRAFGAAGVDFFVVHTGQHYSPNMDSQFFTDLGVPQPKYRLQGVSGRTSHGGQTAAMLDGMEQIFMDERPALVVVGGDANTNLAGALAARKLGLGVAHVEAGERSFDWRMPEEHNRRMIDHISDLLFVSGPKGMENLRRESVQGKIVETGNPIVDASLQHAGLARSKSTILQRLGIEAGGFAVLTTHREENVDFAGNLKNSLKGVSVAAEELGVPVIFPVHPRTRKRLGEFGLSGWAEALPSLRLIDALGYLDFTQLVVSARLVFTDSGGVQQEACIHHVPCVTLRENTEWTETIEIGANRLAGTDPESVRIAAGEAADSSTDWPIPFGDGKASERIVQASIQYIADLGGKEHG